mmetsp:Transcript_28906/g.60154  ORF Transcript_28906/g.60154 Transcript_28906/m.60154 type:complete len:296 (-) Transcript_28906:44-931(-)
MFHRAAPTHPHFSTSSTTIPNPAARMFKTRQKQKRGNRGPSKEVVIDDISTKLIPIVGTKPFAIVLHNLLPPDVCAQLIQRAEDEGFDDALITGPGGKQILRPDIRSCYRCIIDDEDLSDAIYIRIMNALRGTEFEKKIMHAPWMTSIKTRSNALSSNSDHSDEPITAVGLNERMRFIKYEPGHFFARHQDIPYVRGPDCGAKAGERSCITVQLYLNDKFKGGTTRFLSGTRHYDVVPKIGSALIFDHDLLHEGSRVSGGIKYSVRTDIMFAPSLRRMVTPDTLDYDDTFSSASA